MARADVTIEQVFDLVLAAVTMSDDQAYVVPILGTSLDGLRP